MNGNRSSDCYKTLEENEEDKTRDNCLRHNNFTDKSSTSNGYGLVFHSAEINWVKK